MGITKNHIHTPEQIEMARLFKALGHPARIAIIENLLIHEDLNCNGLTKYIQLAQSTISAHLKELHHVGILGVAAIGNNAYYIVNKISLKKVTTYLEKIFLKIEAKNYIESFRYCKPAFKIESPVFPSP